MQNTVTREYIFDYKDIDKVYDIFKNKMKNQYDIKLILRDNFILAKPNYRFTVYDSGTISTVALMGEFICKNDRIILFCRYRFNYLPFIFLLGVMLFFLVIACVGYFFSKNIEFLWLLVGAFLLALIFMLSMYSGIKYDYERIKNSMKWLDAYLMEK